MSALGNIVFFIFGGWIILPGLELAIMHLMLALFFALTIVGIPLAAQHMKLVKVALVPFGQEVREIR